MYKLFFSYLENIEEQLKKSYVFIQIVFLLINEEIMFSTAMFAMKYSILRCSWKIVRTGLK